MWELDVKKAEHWRIDVFELWCWRRLLRVPWTARRSNQSILKGINPEYSLEGLMLKLKLQYFGHLMRRSDSLEKTLLLGKIEGRRRMASLTQQTWVWASSGSWWRTGKPSVLQSMVSQRVGHDWASEQQKQQRQTGSGGGRRGGDGSSQRWRILMSLGWPEPQVPGGSWEWVARVLQLGRSRTGMEVLQWRPACGEEGSPRRQKLEGAYRC